MQLFLETDLINMFNQQGIEDPDFVDKTVLTRRQASCIQSGSTSRCVPFNPLAGEVPHEGVNWQKGPNFGKVTTPDAYQQPRTYRFSLGVRF